VRLPELENCETCMVTLSQPLPHNEIITDLYADIPCYDSMAGLKTFSIQDIISLFNLRGIPETCHEEYFNKITFFHQEYMVGRSEKLNKEDERKSEAQKLAQGVQQNKPVKVQMTRGKDGK